jgi:hypothetical protein
MPLTQPARPGPAHGGPGWCRASAFGVLALLLVACGNESTQPEADLSPPESAPPHLPQQPNWPTVAFPVDDTVARAARDTIRIELNMAGMVTGRGVSLVASFNTVIWGGPPGDCFVWTSTGAACPTQYQACRTGSGYDWSVVREGTCNPLSKSAYTRWTVCDGHSSRDGSSGTLSRYNAGSGGVLFPWTWALSPDLRSGTWTFFDSEAVPASQNAALTRTRDPDGTLHDLWSSGSQTRWELRLPRDSRSGFMKSYRWRTDTSTWRLNREITWDSTGHGSWNTYDLDEQVSSTRRW